MYKRKWEEIIGVLDFAFQPIIDSHTGRLYGVEALLRSYNEAGFDSIGQVFDTAYEENYLYSLDLKLREKVIEKFKEIKFCNDIKLFYNLDNRVLEMPNFCLGNTELILAKYGINKSVITFEISEKHRFNNIIGINNMLSIYKDQGYRKAKEFILKKIILPHCNDNAQKKNTNYKSIILQYCQRNKIELQFETEALPESKTPSFKSSIVMDGEKVCEDLGRSKKEAEQNAAKQAIRIKQIRTEK